MFVCGFWDAHQDLRKNNRTLSRARFDIDGKSNSYCKEKPKSSVTAKLHRLRADAKLVTNSDRHSRDHDRVSGEIAEVRNSP